MEKIRKNPPNPLNKGEKKKIYKGLKPSVDIYRNQQTALAVCPI
jgi:hypothetical protein